MKIVVVNGTEKRGVTYRLKELFLQPFRADAEIAEFYLPEDCPDFCNGCAACCLQGEQYCKDASYVRPIWRAIEGSDLIVMTSPAYVFHASGAMKAFLDHCACRWMPHRPSSPMFSKRAVVITQCLGAGAKSAARDMRDSLSWWGVSQIGVFTARLMSDIVWEKMPEKRRTSLEKKIRKFAVKQAKTDYAKPANTKIGTKVKFYFCRMMQKSLHKRDPQYTDGAYWAEQGWLSSKRPWKRKNIHK